MPWFKVDDQLHDHRKFRRAGLAAMGLWVAAGSWAAANETDGFVPASIVTRWATNARALAKRLVDADLWSAGEQHGEPGWRFHDWAEYQPTKATIEEKRAEARERMRAARSGRKGGSPAPDSGAHPQEGSQDVRANSERSSHNPGPAPAQTPILTLVGRLAVSDARDDQAPPPAEQVRLWQDIAGPDVDLEAEARGYLERYLDRPAADERAAWLGWLRAGAALRTQHAQHAQQPGERRPVCSHAACFGGWLPDDHDGRPVPCPTCRPHLRPVQETA